MFLCYFQKSMYAHTNNYTLVINIQLSSILWLLCCHNFNKLCVMLCLICVPPCCWNACNEGLCCSSGCRCSLAVCQPSKACYVIKDFCALYQVLVIALSLALEVYRTQLIVCLHRRTWSVWTNTSYFHSFVHVSRPSLCVTATANTM